MTRGVRLSPGEPVDFGIEYVFGSCRYYDKGGSEAHHGTKVTCSVLGITKTVEIDYGFDLVLKSRGGGDR